MAQFIALDKVNQVFSNITVMVSNALQTVHSPHIGRAKPASAGMNNGMTA